MKYTFMRDENADRVALLAQYAQRLTGVTDDFWEEHILGAQLWRILADGAPVGWLTLHEGKRLTAFELDHAHRAHAGDVLSRAIDMLGATCAYAPTCDEALLTLCLDRARTVERQAYFFDGTQPPEVRPAEYPRACLRKVAPEELEWVHSLTDGFFRDDATCESLRAGAQAIYALEDGGAPLGFGIAVPLRSRPQYAACGMITIESMRRRGGGRSIQLHLGDICREQGKIPVSGCWYKNELSRKTIESAGRYTYTMLMNITF